LEFCHNLFKDYLFYYDVPITSRVGGVGIYVKNTWNCRIIDKYKFSHQDNIKVENIWLEISKATGKCKYIVGGIYVHPNSNVDALSSVLETTLEDIRSTSTPCIIAGDFNVDLSKYMYHSGTIDYVNNLLANNFLPVIVMPTHITTTSATVIDHIYYYEGKNVKKEFSVKAGNLWCDISDHLPDFFIISSPKQVKRHHEPRLYVRIFFRKEH